MSGGGSTSVAAAPGRTARVVAPVRVPVTFQRYGGGTAALDPALARALCDAATTFFREAGARLAFLPAAGIATFGGTARWGFNVSGTYDPDQLEEIARHPAARGVRVAVCDRFTEPGSSNSQVRGLAVGAEPTLVGQLPGLARTIVYPMTQAIDAVSATRSLSHELGHLLLGPYHDAHRYTAPGGSPVHDLMNGSADRVGAYLTQQQLDIAHRNAAAVARGARPDHSVVPTGSTRGM